ncbi:helix-turn-helix domain-containing protein [Paludibacterium denitrificans]|uniref:XRE family transcriptional regulator n=1 Tax=Paludibacterium denitrificans TaxID=2675226 RepID=A0A844G853_9NEIS|nr:helix-turn-helix transcriptional regulator [Paludibacterium denitrificans]MTD32546.1 XRE family transcriptional regulator [Paludibacterium denitrificans]
MNESLEVLRQAVEQQGQSAVAKTLGYSRSTISLVLAGKYPGRTDQVLARVNEELGKVACPYTGETIALTECMTISARKAPTHNRVKMAYWQACQQCKNCCKGD